MKLFLYVLLLTNTIFSLKPTALTTQEKKLKQQIINNNTINEKVNKINDNNWFNFSFKPFNNTFLNGSSLLKYTLKKYYSTIGLCVLFYLWEIFQFFQLNFIETFLITSYNILINKNIKKKEQKNKEQQSLFVESNDFYLSYFKYINNMWKVFNEWNNLEFIDSINNKNDTITVENKWITIGSLFIVFGLFIFSYGVATYFEYLIGKLVYNINKKHVNTFVDNCLKQSPHKYSKDLIDNIKNNAKLSSKIIEKFVFLAGSFFKVGFVLIKLWMFSWPLLIFNFISIGISGFIFFLYYPQYNLLNKTNNIKQSFDSILLKTTIDNLPLINLLNKQEVFMNYIVKKQHRHNVIFDKSQRLYTKLRIVIGAVQLSYECISYAILFSQLSNGKSNISVIGLWDINKMNKDTVYKFFGIFPALYKNLLDFEKSFTYLLIELEKKIPYRNLIFTGNFKIINGNKTHNNQKILNNINIILDDQLKKKYIKNFYSNIKDLKKNNFNIALVGHSGGGKSTFIKALNGLSPLDEDSLSFEVIIDKNLLKNINKNKYEIVEILDNNQVRIWIKSKAINPKELRYNFLNVSQDPQIINDSILINFSFGGYYDQSIIKFILKKVNLWSNINEKPKKLKTYLGSGSYKPLSGGQEQRINIARALYEKLMKNLDNKENYKIIKKKLGSILKNFLNTEEAYENILFNPDYQESSSNFFMFCDEPTSALDSGNATLIDNIFNSIPGTKLNVTHKLIDLEKKSDFILVFSGGEIVEYGNYKELIEKKGIFFEMINNKNNLYDHVDD